MFCEECKKKTTIIVQDESVLSDCCYAYVYHDKELLNLYTWGEYKTEEAEYWTESKADDVRMRELN